MSSNNNQVFVDVVLYMAIPMFLFFVFLSQWSDLFLHDIVLFDSVSVQNIYN